MYTICIHITYIYIYMLAPPRFTFLVKIHCKLQGIMKHTLFTTLCSGQLHVTINVVNCMDLVEQRTLGIEPGTSCIRGQALTN